MDTSVPPCPLGVQDKSAGVQCFDGFRALPSPSSMHVCGMSSLSCFCLSVSGGILSETVMEDPLLSSSDFSGGLTMLVMNADAVLAAGSTCERISGKRVGHPVRDHTGGEVTIHPDRDRAGRKLPPFPAVLRHGVAAAVGAALLGLTGPQVMARSVDGLENPAQAQAYQSQQQPQRSISPSHPQPQSQQQVPGVYRLQLGQLQVTALLDGFLPIPEKTVQGIGRTKLDAALKQAHVPQFTAAPLGTGMQTAVNAFLVRRGDRLMLVDTGAGTWFGTSTGRLLQTMQAAGVDPVAVTDVLLTHAHPDHICGLLLPDGSEAFPKATVWLPDDEAAYWLDEREMARAPEDMKAAFGMAAKALAPYSKDGRVRRVVPSIASTKPSSIRSGERASGQAGASASEEQADASASDRTAASASDGSATDTGHQAVHRASFGIHRVTERDLPPGVTLVTTHGHTPGHASWLVDGRLLLWGDIVHYHAVQFARPVVYSSFDSIPAQAIASRKRLFADAARHDWWVGGAHLPFPGLGHVIPQGRGYRWIPGEFSPLP